MSKLDITQFVIDISQYRIVKEVINNRFGTCMLCENKITKQISLVNNIPWSLEVLKLGRLVHLAFLPIQGVVLQTDSHPFAIVEAATKLTLADMLKSQEAFNQACETKYQNIAFGIASAMKYSHENGFLHGDLTANSVYISDDYTPLVHGIGFGTICGLTRSTDLKNFGLILEQMFKSADCTFEQNLAYKIKVNEIKSFAEVVEMMSKQYTSNYVRRLVLFENARNIYDGTQLVSKCDFLALSIKSIGTSPAVAMANMYNHICGKEPIPVPPVNAVMIGTHTDKDLQSMIYNYKDFKLTGELQIPSGTSFIATRNGKKYLLSTASLNLKLRSRIDLLHPALSNACGIILADETHPFFIVEDYGEQIPNELIGEALLATAAALSYCHENDIHHGQLRPHCLSLVGKFIHLSLAGIAESFGRRITEYDDVLAFGQMGLSLYKNASEEVKKIFEECTKNKQLTMKEVYERLVSCQISDDYCNMLSQFESRRQRASMGDTVALQDLNHMMATLCSDCRQLPDLEENLIMTAPPLYMAALKNDVKEINRLLKKGVNPNTTAIDGSTALHAAALAGNLAAIEALTGKVDPMKKDILGRTAIDVAGPQERWAMKKKANPFVTSILKSIIHLIG